MKTLIVFLTSFLLTGICSAAPTIVRLFEGQPERDNGRSIPVCQWPCRYLEISIENSELTIRVGQANRSYRSLVDVPASLEMVDGGDLITRMNLTPELLQKIEVQIGMKSRNAFEIARNLTFFLVDVVGTVMMGGLTYLAINEPGMEGLAALTGPGTLFYGGFAGKFAYHFVQDIRGRANIQKFVRNLSDAFSKSGFSNFFVINRNVGLVRGTAQFMGIYRTQFSLVVNSWVDFARKLEVSHSKNNCKILFL